MRNTTLWIIFFIHHHFFEMVSLLDSVHEHLTPAFVNETAQWLGENDNATAKALGAWSATILAGTLHYAGHDKAINRIYNHLGLFPPDIMEKPEALLRRGNLAQNDPKDVAGHLMGQLFGPKIDVLTNSIAAFSGLNPKSVSELLGITAPIVLSILGKRVQASALTVAGLTNTLRADQERILGAVPSGLGVVLGLHAAPASAPGPEPATGMRWLLPLLLLLVLGGGLMALLRGCSAP